ncbi:IS66 family insertion sequence element accessory protein TnpA [Teredinibacter purpureus]|uniref:IS66 family insertion sequence element accessory protein TnpA n=1 Tax=Teredinibacter purpureus TaxID=2731756 RepID=UPI0038B4531F
MAKHRSPRLSESEWQTLYERYESSDLTMTDFCKKQKISYANFRRRRKIHN